VDGGGEGDYEGYGQDDTAATAATTGATGATATPAAAATGFTLAGSSQVSSLAPAASGTQFTCFTATKVQILTQRQAQQRRSFPSALPATRQARQQSL
jgi:hypothetical protein